MVIEQMFSLLVNFNCLYSNRLALENYIRLLYPDSAYRYTYRSVRASIMTRTSAMKSASAGMQACTA